MKQKSESMMKKRFFPGLVLMLAGMLVLVYALTNVVGLQQEKRETEQLYKKAREAAHLLQPVSQLKAVDIDFQGLLEMNTDTIGWLRIEGMDIDYPVVRSMDNEEYLYRGFDGTARRAGTLFLDKDADANFAGLNHPIYGHNMKDGTMFGTLKAYLDSDFALEHLNMAFYTPEKAWRLIPISVYTAESSGDYHTQPENAQEAYERAQGWVNKSAVAFQAELQPEDTYLTLVTCTSDTLDHRVVLHAVFKAE